MAANKSTLPESTLIWIILLVSLSILHSSGSACLVIWFRMFGCSKQWRYEPIQFRANDQMISHSIFPVVDLKAVNFEQDDFMLERVWVDDEAAFTCISSWPHAIERGSKGTILKCKWYEGALQYGPATPASNQLQETRDGVPMWDGVLISYWGH